MQWSVGVISAPRGIETVQQTVDSIRGALLNVPVMVFREPCEYFDVTGCQAIRRPGTISQTKMPSSPQGVFGNFGNWIQSARDILLYDEGKMSAIMMCEDDILITPAIRDLLESHLWPASDCGVISLYSPGLSQYRSNMNGLVRTAVKYKDPMTSVGNMVGALALVFHPDVLRALVTHPSIETWKGSHYQNKQAHLDPWERKAVDTWIGRTLLALGYSIWHFSPSLVKHNMPSADNSSLGHGAANRIRSAYKWAGCSERALSIYPPAGRTYENIHPHPV